MSLRQIACSLLLLGWSVPCLAAGELPTSSTLSSIVRFRQVDERLYRGGQPGKAGFEALRQLGVQTVINLRAEDASEQMIVESLGMKFIHLPVTMKPFGASGPVPEAMLRRFLQVVSDPSNGVVFIHCRHGKDRTGLFVSLYRVAQQGWSVERAFGEARDMGMAWWHSGSRRQLDAFAASLAGKDSSTPALEVLPSRGGTP